ncbi:MAG: maltose alpha-D-glucosyltransferase [Chloroflexi bacterium]|nr:maltose alpha-D-glucosyltransferase [Chloroflexota bacterium]
MTWYKDAVFYEVYVRAFCDGNGDGHGDLQGLTSKLGYLQELGVDCLWLLPMYDSPLVDDGYDVRDFLKIHQDYGTVEDFKEMVQEAHRRGLRVIADLVMNHTSDQHAWFQEARSSKSSPKRDYYLWSRTNQKFKDARIIFVDSQESNWEFDPLTGEYYFHRFYPQQPDLNYDNPAVQQAMLGVMKHWLDLGIDGFRADAVPYLFKREGTNCENLPETHAYLKRVRRFLDENYRGKVLLAEANQWPEEVREYFGAGDEFHMCLHFPLMPRIFLALEREDRRPLVDILNRTPPIPESCQWGTFLRCHDELTLEMVTEEDRQFLWDAYAPDHQMRLNLGIRLRLSPLLNNDRRRIELAYSLLFTLPGSPIIYYGDEIGMGDNITLKDRGGLRTPMQWSDEENAGFSVAHPSAMYSPVNDDEVFGYKRINARSQLGDPSSLFHTVRMMILARKRHRAFGRGNCQFLGPQNTAVLAYLRRYESEDILVVQNLSSSRQSVSLELPEFPACLPVDVLTGGAFAPVSRGPYALGLDPYQYLWLTLKPLSQPIP